MYHFRGASLKEASRAAGYKTTLTLKRLLADPAVAVILEYVRDREFTDIRVTRDSVTSMFMEAYSKAATAGEMVAAARELGKLHGLYPDTKPNTSIEVKVDGQGTEVSVKKLERMSDNELLKLAPALINELAPPELIAGECEVVDE
ncbi:MAG: hypothetical protein ACRBBW_16335 [Cellvibrionaceae bacterium]